MVNKFQPTPLELEVGLKVLIQEQGSFSKPDRYIIKVVCTEVRSGEFVVEKTGKKVSRNRRLYIFG